jgi:hypothetical protein
MTKRTVWMLTVMTLALSWGMGVARSNAQMTDRPKPPPHLMRGPGGLCADDAYLYVLQGHRILQVERSSMGLLTTLDLPRPEPPPQTASKDATSTEQTPPFPPVGGAAGCWAGDGVLYVVTGPVLRKYSVSDTGLTLESSVELPRPEPPQKSN